MKKYKQKIKIGNNVTDIMKLPCVTACYKLNDKRGLEWLEYEIQIDGQKTRAEAGDWICEDYDGHWAVHAEDSFNN